MKTQQQKTKKINPLHARIDYLSKKYQHIFQRNQSNEVIQMTKQTFIDDYHISNVELATL